MTRFELITSKEYIAASIEVKLWEMAGQPKFKTSKFETQGKKIAEVIMPTIQEIIELLSTNKD